MIDIIFSKIEYPILLMIAELFFVPLRKTKKLSFLPFLASLSINILLYYFVWIPNYWFMTMREAACIAISIAAMFLTWKISWQHALFFGLCAHAIQYVGYHLDSVFRILLNMYPGISTFLENNVNFYLFTKIIYAFLYPAFYFIFIKPLKTKYSLHITAPIQLLFAFFMLLTGIAFNLFVFVSQASPPPPMTILLYRLIAISNYIFLLFIQFYLLKVSKLSTDKYALEQIILSAKRRHDASKENMLFINLKCHDLKKLVRNLRNIPTNQIKEENIQKIEEAIQFFDNTVHTGNEALDVLLFEKSQLYNRHDIRFTPLIDASSLSFMDLIDLYALFGNALDNAYESQLRTTDTQKRFIDLRGNKKEKIYRITIENYYEGQIVFADGLPQTSDPDTVSHGYGMYSIKSIVQKYHGHMLVKAENNVFSLLINLPIPSSTLSRS